MSCVESAMAESQLRDKSISSFKAQDVFPRKCWIAVCGAMLGAFMAVLDIQITNASLKDITGALGATLDEGSWISTAYLVAEIIVIPLSGWLAQVFSIRTYLLGTAAVFLFMSVLCASAWDLNSMIVFRALQGLSGGALIPLALTILLTYLPPQKHPVGLAMFALTATFAPAIGPTVGGWLTETYSWVSIFYVNLVPGIVLWLACFYTLKHEPMRLNLLCTGDYWGIGTMATGLGSLTVFLEEGNRKDWFGSPLIVRLAVTAVLSLTAFFIIELRQQNPVVNLRLFRRRNFALSTLINTCLGLGLYGSIYILPLYLAQIQGYNALQIGETIMYAGMPQLFLIPLTARLMKIVDLRLMIFCGCLLFGISCFMNAFMSIDTAIDQLRWSQLVRAVGQPLLFVPLLSVATAGLPPQDAGAASGLFNMMRNLGGSTGIAALSTLLTRREQFHSGRIGENVSSSSWTTEARLDQLTQAFFRHGSEPATAARQALGMTDNLVRREAFIMGYNDCFFFIGTALVMCGFLVLFLPKVRPAAGPAAGH